MAASRLTVTLPETEINFLKKFAKKNKISVSELMDQWIKSLKAESKPAIHPDVKKFTGIIPTDVDVNEAYSEYIMEKHK